MIIGWAGVMLGVSGLIVFFPIWPKHLGKQQWLNGDVMVILCFPFSENRDEPPSCSMAILDNDVLNI